MGIVAAVENDLLCLVRLLLVQEILVDGKFCNGIRYMGIQTFIFYSQVALLFSHKVSFCSVAEDLELSLRLFSQER